MSPPANPREEIAGLEKAIEATKKRITDYKTAEGVNVADIEFHLKNLIRQLGEAQKRAKTKV